MLLRIPHFYGLLIGSITPLRGMYTCVCIPKQHQRTKQINIHILQYFVFVMLKVYHGSDQPPPSSIRLLK